MVLVWKMAAEGRRTEKTYYRLYWSGDYLVRPEGLEPPTPRSVASADEDTTE